MTLQEAGVASRWEKTLTQAVRQDVHELGKVWVRGSHDEAHRAEAHKGDEHADAAGAGLGFGAAPPHTQAVWALHTAHASLFQGLI